MTSMTVMSVTLMLSGKKIQKRPSRGHPDNKCSESYMKSISGGGHFWCSCRLSALSKLDCKRQVSLTSFGVTLVNVRLYSWQSLLTGLVIVLLDVSDWRPN